LRTRYKLAQPGRFFFDPLFYLEYNRKIDLTRQNKLESKLILGRDFDRLNLSLNQVFEFSWAPGKPEYELGIDWGLSYELSFAVSLGLESSFRIETPGDEEESKKLYLGPTLSLAKSPIYYTMSYQEGVTPEADKRRFRLLIGVDL
jgi:hypothetical protein